MKNRKAKILFAMAFLIFISFMLVVFFGSDWFTEEKYIGVDMDESYVNGTVLDREKVDNTTGEIPAKLIYDNEQKWWMIPAILVVMGCCYGSMIWGSECIKAERLKNFSKEMKDDWNKLEKEGLSDNCCFDCVSILKDYEKENPENRFARGIVCDKCREKKYPNRENYILGKDKPMHCCKCLAVLDVAEKKNKGNIMSPLRIMCDDCKVLHGDIDGGHVPKYKKGFMTSFVCNIYSCDKCPLSQGTICAETNEAYDFKSCPFKEGENDE